MHKISIQAYTV